MEKIRFVLVHTTHPGNIGAAARAIKNMGFHELCLVNPAHYPHPDALARCSGADEVLHNAVVVSSLKEAISDCHLIIGTSSRDRSLPIPLLTPKVCAERVKENIGQGNKIAILFGQERMGLTNEELSLCHFHLFIPCNSDFPSLNIAAAVQIIAYELHCALVGETLPSSLPPVLANLEEMERFYTQLERTLIEIKFLDANNPRQLMRKLRRLFNRTALEQNEINILRGILASVSKA